MTASEANLGLARHYLSLMASGELDGALALCTDDIQFRGPDGSLLDKAGLRAIFAGIASLMVNPMEQEIISSFSDDTRVAIEATGRTLLGNGREYNNIYAFIFEIDQGAITACREYCDTTKFAAFGPA